MSGFIYTLERGYSMLSTSIIKAGFFSGQMTGAVPDVKINGLFDNLYVPLFFIIGLLFILYSFRKKVIFEGSSR